MTINSLDNLGVTTPDDTRRSASAESLPTQDDALFDLFSVLNKVRLSDDQASALFDEAKQGLSTSQEHLPSTGIVIPFKVSHKATGSTRELSSVYHCEMRLEPVNAADQLNTLESEGSYNTILTVIDNGIGRESRRLGRSDSALTQSTASINPDVAPERQKITVILVSPAVGSRESVVVFLNDEQKVAFDAEGNCLSTHVSALELAEIGKSLTTTLATQHPKYLPQLFSSSEVEEYEAYKDLQAKLAEFLHAEMTPSEALASVREGGKYAVLVKEIEDNDHKLYNFFKTPLPLPTAKTVELAKEAKVSNDYDSLHQKYLYAQKRFPNDKVKQVQAFKASAAEKVAAFLGVNAAKLANLVSHNKFEFFPKETSVGNKLTSAALAATSVAVPFVSGRASNYYQSNKANKRQQEMDALSGHKNSIPTIALSTKAKGSVLRVVNPETTTVADLATVVDVINPDAYSARVRGSIRTKKETIQSVIASLVSLYGASAPVGSDKGLLILAESVVNLAHALNHDNSLVRDSHGSTSPEYTAVNAKLDLINARLADLAKSENLKVHFEDILNSPEFKRLKRSMHQSSSLPRVRSSRELLGNIASQRGGANKTQQNKLTNISIDDMATINNKLEQLIEQNQKSLDVLQKQMVELSQQVEEKANISQVDSLEARLNALEKSKSQSLADPKVGQLEQRIEELSKKLARVQSSGKTAGGSTALDAMLLKMPEKILTAKHNKSLEAYDSVREKFKIASAESKEYKAYAEQAMGQLMVAIEDHCPLLLNVVAAATGTSVNQQPEEFRRNVFEALELLTQPDAISQLVERYKKTPYISNPSSRTSGGLEIFPVLIIHNRDGSEERVDLRGVKANDDRVLQAGAIDWRVAPASAVKNLKPADLLKESKTIVRSTFVSTSPTSEAGVYVKEAIENGETVRQALRNAPVSLLSDVQQVLFKVQALSSQQQYIHNVGGEDDFKLSEETDYMTSLSGSPVTQEGHHVGSYPLNLEERTDTGKVVGWFTNAPGLGVRSEVRTTREANEYLTLAHQEGRGPTTLAGVLTTAALTCTAAEVVQNPHTAKFLRTHAELTTAINQATDAVQSYATELKSLKSKMKELDKFHKVNLQGASHLISFSADPVERGNKLYVPSKILEDVKTPSPTNRSEAQALATTRGATTADLADTVDLRNNSTRHSAGQSRVGTSTAYAQTRTATAATRFGTTTARQTRDLDAGILNKTKSPSVTAAGTAIATR